MTVWVNRAEVYLCRSGQTTGQMKALSMKVWQGSSQNPTLPVDLVLQTLGNSWFFQTCWAPSDSSVRQTGACVPDTTPDTFHDSFKASLNI